MAEKAVKGDYSWDKVGERIIKVYESLVG